MSLSRRDFIKTAGLTTGAAVAGVAASTAPRRARAHDKARGDPDLPRGVTLASIRRGDEWHLAARTERGVLDIAGAADALDIDAPESMDELLAEGGGKAVEQVVKQALAGNRAQSYFHDEAKLEFAPAVPNPQKIIMVGLNYRKHVAEVNGKVPTTPMLFNKYNNSLLGHGGTVRLPTRVSSEFDYEVELVIVIGRHASNVSEAQALSHVFGYCTGNDFSARDLQKKSSQFMLGKTCDGFAPLGPWLVTADQIPDPNKLHLWCEVNGERRQSSNTSDMVFNCAQLISYASQHMTLEPGDIIYTGTPEGVIAGMPADKRIWLKAGDKLRCAVEPLGELRFTLA